MKKRRGGERKEEEKRKEGRKKLIDVRFFAPRDKIFFLSPTPLLPPFFPLLSANDAIKPTYPTLIMQKFVNGLSILLRNMLLN